MPDRGSSNSNANGALSFEEAFARLEKTVQALEQGGMPLEEATRLYEEGMLLAKQCNQLLAATELKVTRLRNAYLPAASKDEDEEE